VRASPAPPDPRRRRRRATRLLVAFALLLLGGGLFTVYGRTPRSERDWAADQATAAGVTVSGESVEIRSLRDFRHDSAGIVSQRYLDDTVPLEEVRRVWFVVSPFASGLAHVFLSFELTGDRFVAVSVEARRERGETYSVLGGLLRRFEITYVVGTEPDLLGMRALRGDALVLYPSRATPEQARALFADMMTSAERLERDPAFYNSLLRNCASVLRGHVNGILEQPISSRWATLLPAFADGVALDRGLLDTDLPIDEARERFRVDERVRRALAEGLEGTEFSREIREGP
jgi:hypothetical protein